MSARNPAARNRRREVAIVAAALLLPVPLLAATAVRLPLPAAVERGLASVTPGGSLDVVIRKPAPAEPDSARAGRSAGPLGSAAVVSGEQGASSAFFGDPGSQAPDRGSRTDRPQGGAAEPPETLPPDTGSDDPPDGDLPVPPPERPPAEPGLPPATATPTGPPPELAVGLASGGLSTDVEAGDDGLDVTVSAGDVLPPTTVAVPLP